LYIVSSKINTQNKTRTYDTKLREFHASDCITEIGYTLNNNKEEKEEE
jgi:hypothetical protein